MDLKTHIEEARTALETLKTERASLGEAVGLIEDPMQSVGIAFHAQNMDHAIAEMAEALNLIEKAHNEGEEHTDEQ